MADYPRCGARMGDATCQIHRDAEHELHEAMIFVQERRVWPNDTLAPVPSGGVQATEEEGA